MSEFLAVLLLALLTRPLWRRGGHLHQDFLVRYRGYMPDPLAEDALEEGTRTAAPLPSRLVVAAVGFAVVGAALVAIADSGGSGIGAGITALFYGAVALLCFMVAVGCWVVRLWRRRRAAKREPRPARLAPQHRHLPRH